MTSTSKGVTTRQLRAMCTWWQKRLGLVDWDISVQFKTGAEMDGAQGSCEPIPRLRTAIIYVIRAEDYESGGGAYPQDVESTIVHELLHCYHHMTRMGSVAEMFEEQGVEATSKALVQLKRERAALISARTRVR